MRSIVSMIITTMIIMRTPTIIVRRSKTRMVGAALEVVRAIPVRTELKTRIALVIVYILGAEVAARIVCVQTANAAPMELSIERLVSVAAQPVV